LRTRACFPFLNHPTHALSRSRALTHSHALHPHFQADYELNPHRRRGGQERLPLAGSLMVT